MCRHLAYVGPGAVMSAFFFDPPHSLEHQTYAARELLEGHVNVDGFGTAWYPIETGGTSGSSVVGDRDEPLAYRSERPVWADPVWKGLASRFRGRIVLANVRNATDPATAGLGAVHPFTRGRWSFTHNGFLSGYRDHFMVPLERRLSEKRLTQRQGMSDTQTLFLLLLDKLERSGPKEALVELVEEVVALAHEVQQPTYLNFLLSDGQRVWGTRCGTAPRHPSLWVAHSPERFPGGSVIASEALDEDPAWQQVPQGSLVELRAGEPPDVTSLDVQE